MTNNLSVAVKDVISLTNLKPNTHVNSVMSSLVDSVIHDTTTELSSFSTELIDQVRTISSDAETQMEEYWAEQIIHAPDPFTALQAFPYLGNYVELTRREIDLVTKSDKKLDTTSRTLVIGSGPLPLSAIELHRQTGTAIDHVDSSSKAIAFSDQLTTALGVTSGHYHALGHKVTLKQTYDVILIAALAGSTVADKQAIINNVLPSLKPGGRVIVRSATGNRELLYPGIDATALTGVTLLQEYHPTDYIINSVLIYGKHHD